MASVVQICNMALTRIGQSQLITSLDEQSLAAELCTLHYADARDFVLRDFDWPFAEARVFLSDIGSPPVNWSFRYRYPTDCLKARRIAIPGNENPTADQRTPYKVVHAAGGRAIITNQQEAELVYTVRVEDTTYFDPMFVSALAWRLGSELAIGLQVRPENFNAAQQQYMFVLGQAQAVALAEAEQLPLPESEFITARN
ncbi:MAG: hypothetical protein COA41_11330 [Sphingopyxis sp.]|nr:MAG: hypothetical protein COA41_11330 [Sphingopyxis sp.]